MVHLDDIDLAFGTGWSKVRVTRSSIHRPGRLAGKPVLWNEESFRAVPRLLAPLLRSACDRSPGVQERVELAIRCLGMARSVGTPWAMKLIALFAGLEAILITGEGERRKGAALAIRFLRCSRSRWTDWQSGHPGEALVLYRDRSELVHGARAAADEGLIPADLLSRGRWTQEFYALLPLGPHIETTSRYWTRSPLLRGSSTTSSCWVTSDYRPRGEQELLAGIERLMREGPK